MHAISSAVTPACSSAFGIATCAACHQSCGSCSAHPLWGDANALCSCVALPTTLPRSSTTIARVPPVPISMPSSFSLIESRLHTSSQTNAMVEATRFAYHWVRRQHSRCKRLQVFHGRKDRRDKRIQKRETAHAGDTPAIWKPDVNRGHLPHHSLRISSTIRPPCCSL